MSRHALLPALAVAAALASPAAAVQTGPVCTASLLNAAAGDVTTCVSQGPSALGNRDVGAYRTVFVTVVTGSVLADVRCGSVLAASGTFTESGKLGGWSGGYDCVVTLTSLAPGTTADALSVGHYVIVLE
ncbi:MAG TPA: hypothetical protein VGX28_15775 [Frankiaceae bacterium]|jgi:hypothetical protein|nr:hypothetical protein [Frankiaceae bacterium]